MKIGVLIPVPNRNGLFTQGSWAELTALGTVVANAGDKQLTVDEAAAMLADCDVAVGSWGTAHPATPGLLARLPKLKLWVHAAGTVKHMITPEVTARGLVVASCAPAIGEDVADTVLGEIIIGLRRIIPNGQANRTTVGAPARNKKTLPFATVGVVGASTVGRCVINRLLPLGPAVLVYDPYLTEAAARELGVTKIDDVTELCRRSDAVTLHTPPLEATRHIMGAKQFQAMADDAVFVNAARGMCVDEAALIAELSKGRLFAFLDVSDPEPTPADSPFRKLPNVVYTSHIAGGGSPRIGQQVVADIQAFVAGRSPRMAVTADMLARIA